MSKHLHIEELEKKIHELEKENAELKEQIKRNRSQYFDALKIADNNAKEVESRLIKAQKTLQHSHDLMRYVIEHSRSAIAVHDRDLNYVYVSQRYLKEYDVKDTDVIGRHHYDIFPDLPEKWRIIHQKALNGEISSGDNDIYIRADGSVEWTRWECRPWFESDGSIGGIIVYSEMITDRVKMEETLGETNERLKQSYDLLRNLADQVPGVIYQYRLYPDGRSSFPWSSSGMWNIYECTPDEVREDASKVFTRLHPEDIDYVAEAIFESARNLSLFHVEFRVILPEQGLRWRSSFAKPERCSDGSTLWHGIITDITVRKEIEHELDLKNEELNTFFDCALDLLCIASTEGYFLRLNKEWENVLGYSLEELEHHRFLDFIHPDDLEATTNIMGVLMDQQNVINFINRYKAKTGEYKWIEWKSYPKGSKIFAAARDITERIRIETELTESKEQLRFAFEGSNDGLWDVNFISGSSFLSARGCEILGYGFEEFNKMSKDRYMIFNQEAMPAVNRSLQDHFSGKTEIFEVEVPLRKKTGTFIWGLIRGKLVSMDENGKPVRMTGTISDISDRKKAENEIKKLNEELENRIQLRTKELLETNKELEAFSYSVSHDLRSPLRAIIGYTNILLEDYGQFLDDGGRRVTQVISSNAVKMGKLIDDLLSFSRFSRNEMQFTNFSMKELVNSVFSELIVFNEHNVIDYELQDLPMVTGDFSMLKQVWVNLISNAIKYTSQRQHAIIKVGFTEKQDEITYYVSDNGIGFDMQYAGKLFGVFHRLHNTRDFEGTGVGLAIVKRIIVRHGGRVWAKGGLDSGATFYISLPKRNLNEKQDT